MNRKLYFSTTLIIAIIVMVNLLAGSFHLRMDFTEGNEYTLSKATRDILNNLEEPVTITAYFSKDLPPNVIKVRKDFQELLVEYAVRSDGMLLYDFVNPSGDETMEQEAVQKGIQPVVINVREKDQVKQQKAYLGATVAMGDENEVIPVIQPGTAMEYALSTVIKKMSVKDKPSVGFIQGHGEPPLSQVRQLRQQLDVLYNCQEINIDSANIPEVMHTLVLIRPQDTIQQAVFGKLDQFLANGGRLAIAMNRVEGNLQNAYGYVVTTGLEQWLERKGVVVRDNFVVDAKCGQVTLVQQGGSFSIQQRIAFPYLPLAAKFADHPVSTGLENVLFRFVSSVQFAGDTTTRFTPLVFSSDMSGTRKAPQYFDVQQQWTEDDFTDKGLVLAAALEPLHGIGYRMVVVGDGDFIVNGPQQQGQSQQLQPDNVNLMANAIDWLSDDTGLIELRTKGATSRPIEELEDSTRSILKYGNFFVPIFLVIAYGLVRAQRSKMKRFRRMSEDYEED